MREITAPYGYEIAEEISFVMNDGIKVTMKDNLILRTIQLTKIDKDTKEIIKDNFTFGLYADKDCTQIIQQIDSNAKEGTVTFKDIKFGTYYVKEITAPKGYIKSDKVIKIEVNDKGVFVNKKEIQEDNSIYKFEFENILMDTPKTSDDRNTILYILAFIMSAAGIVIIGIAEHKRKKQNKQK